jgi:hypothetical protein
MLVDVRERTLEPGEEVPLTIKVQLDELIRFRDQLNILVVEGADTTVPLEALGVGSVVTCDEVDEQGNVNFGPQFNGRSFTRELVLVNNGREMFSSSSSPSTSSSSSFYSSSSPSTSSSAFSSSSFSSSSSSSSSSPSPR